jgi:hypothetical protein
MSGDRRGSPSMPRVAGGRDDAGAPGKGRRASRETRVEEKAETRAARPGRALWPYSPPAWGGLPDEWAAAAYQDEAGRDRKARFCDGVDLAVYHSGSSATGKDIGGGGLAAPRIGSFDLMQKEHYIIGRDAKRCDLVVHHDSISRVHAVLQWRRRDGACLLQDLASQHGTFVGAQSGAGGGKRVNPGAFVPLQVVGLDGQAAEYSQSEAAGGAWFRLGSSKRAYRLEVRGRRQGSGEAERSLWQPQGAQEQGGAGEEADAQNGGADEDCHELLRLWNAKRSGGEVGADRARAAALSYGHSSSSSDESESGSWGAAGSEPGDDSRQGDRRRRVVEAERRVVNLALSLKAHEVSFSEQQRQDLERIDWLVSTIARTNRVLDTLRRDVRSGAAAFLARSRQLSWHAQGSQPLDCLNPEP